MCGACHDLDDCCVFISQTVEDEAKCCSGINSVMAVMDLFQRITLQGPVNSEVHVRYVRKNIQLAYMDSRLKKKE